MNKQIIESLELIANRLMAMHGNLVGDPRIQKNIREAIQNEYRTAAMDIYKIIKDNK